jgi:hypothetical protein
MLNLENDHFAIAKLIIADEEPIILEDLIDFSIVITPEAVKLKLIFNKIQDWLIPLLPFARYLFEIRQRKNAELIERLGFKFLEFDKRNDNVVLYNIVDTKQWLTQVEPLFTFERAKMKNIILIETAEELMKFANPANDKEPFFLGENAMLVFENDMKHVLLQNAPGFQLSSEITAISIIEKMASNCHLKIHIT